MPGFSLTLLFKFSSADYLPSTVRTMQSGIIALTAAAVVVAVTVVGVQYDGIEVDEAGAQDAMPTDRARVMAEKMACIFGSIGCVRRLVRRV